MSHLPSRGRDRHIDRVSERESISTAERIQVWQWPNVLSLDAVAIGLFWQITFTVEFCGRMPIWYETVITCVSIWLVYVADRLLDAKRIDPAKPHSLRHGFHQQHRTAVTIAWGAVLCTNAFLIFRFPTYDQLRWGSIAVGAVCCYLVLVQCLSQEQLGSRTGIQSGVRKWIPKEVFAGCVFSFGIGLVPLASDRINTDASLVIACGLASTLFSINCSIVATMESYFDRAQNFPSVATQFRPLGGSLKLGLIGITLMSLLLFVAGLLGRWVSVGLAASSLGMLVVMHLSPLSKGGDKNNIQRTRQVQLLVLAIDIATLLGPLLTCVWIQVEQAS